MYNHFSFEMRKVYITVITFFVMFGAMTGASFAADRLKLDETSIVGTRELPKVLYIVPWKESNLGALAGTSKPGRYDAGMVPVERDSYAREIEYFEMLKGDAGIGGVAR